ncbi:Methylthioribose-1-phosphate isomerase [Neomoorella glycerini]|uniref:Methylthioribose-1-phosphate isomerase n=1 Tax=Neomoorella glycerini TaxID=55779 RepID=A0A6I5ZTR9_9FIRM|nr:S-methyl-5-thioribose-1-phosphate isomerase [Moorella glycerini]QGP93088.1 Methylthioribose-1-phosphate isomerase [Moorella glycerini]
MTQLVNALVQELRERELLLPIWGEGEKVVLLDQTRLPFKTVYLEIYTVVELCTAIKDMTIRGSGALGLAGAWGAYLASLKNDNLEAFQRDLAALKATRPTAVNLAKTVDEIGTDLDPRQFKEQVVQRLIDIVHRQLNFELALGEAGAALIHDGDTIMTHCHSGALAGAGYGGRALSVIRRAWEQGKKISVLVNETRPYLQGARITAWELKRLGIPFTLITDNMSGFCLEKGMVNLVVVGSDRVARNGDLANKIGTYLHALAAYDNNVPFYTATSSHTIDLNTPSGDTIPVEMRPAEEVLTLAGQPIAEPGTKALYPAFDITPHRLITGIITEKGVIYPPFEKNLVEIFG